MHNWIPVERELPYERDVVSIQTAVGIRRGYYRIENRWYALVDLERWQMNTSPYWERDRTWYLTTSAIRAWMPEQPEKGDEVTADQESDR